MHEHDDERDGDINVINSDTSNMSGMSSSTTSISSGKRTSSGGIGGGGSGIIMPQVNAHSARLLLFNRKNWSRFRFGDVVVNVEEAKR